ncbi:sensor histidine kinase [Fulvivirga sediminis]|uniref:histidine kinase n=1 Tax=Fulvivirga sediminis TaxID=2803949 RepID=A0A937F8K5_9BACT|nr:ATP-binding protein [Fulvivirga sediminis]MBL3658311.1 GHKL domain-containing protein [Fulvivirga sediminis]
MKFYKKFSFKVVIRIIFILIVMTAFASIFGDSRLFFNHIILSLIMMAQVWELIRFINLTNRELSKFLLSIKHKDFTVHFNKATVSDSFKELNQAFNEIIASYKQSQIENEGQFHYLKMVVNHINVGILSIENELDIVLMNKTAESLLQAQGIKNWNILKSKHPSFVHEINQLQNSGRKLVSIESGSNRTLSVEVNSMQLLGKTYKLITFQDIKDEIEQTEIEAWHKLIRILTHEIMNSATPISSLTETMQGMLSKNGDQIPLSDLNEEIIDDLRFSLKTIQKRSDGMLAFIDDYRKLTKVSNPRLEEVDVSELFQHIHLLMKRQMDENNIHFKMACDIHTINLDRHLIEQVLINLITNSIHALERKETPEISLTAHYMGEKACIAVTDNGSGIPKVELSQIFVPFYSTKKQGSGIGLSLSKQIMHLHKGYIKVDSEDGKGTTISLYFRG